MQVLEHCCGSGYRISCLESDLYIFYPKLPKTLDQTTATPWQLENLGCKVNNAQISILSIRSNEFSNSDYNNYNRDVI